MVRQRYSTPPESVVEDFERSVTRSATISPELGQFAILEWETHCDIERLASTTTRMLDSSCDGTPRPGNWMPSVVAVDLRDLTAPHDPNRIVLPKECRWVSFSPSGAGIAFTQTTERGVHLGIVDTQLKCYEPLFDVRLNAMSRSVCKWVSNVELIAKGARAMGADEPIHALQGPKVYEPGSTSGQISDKSLPRTSATSGLRARYGMSQLIAVNLADRSTRKIGPEQLITDFSPSPSGQYLIVEFWEIRTDPTTDAVDWHRHNEIWSVVGPASPVPTPLQNPQWHPSQPATLIGLLKGNKLNERHGPNTVVKAKSPFDDVQPWVSFEKTIRSVRWTTAGLAIVAIDGDDRALEIWTVSDDGERRFLMTANDANAPGFLTQWAITNRVSTTQALSPQVLQVDGSLYICNRKSTRCVTPYVDTINIHTREVRRLFQSSADVHEEPIALLSPKQLLTSLESHLKAPNYYLRHLEEDSVDQITNYVSESTLPNNSQHRLAYRRTDGIDLDATLYIPADCGGSQSTPLVLWIYPEGDDSGGLGQSWAFGSRFPRYDGLSPFSLLSRGISVLLHPAIPIVNRGECPNDSYIEQLIEGAQMAVLAAQSRGVGVNGQIGVGGISYGAAAVASLLAHTSLFRAGVAVSGAYNRTLTPFGFQNERRTFWQAPEVYFALSPFCSADRISAPLLLIHGEEDDHPGTPAQQSIRLFEAIAGNGGACRLVLLPREGHILMARESVLHATAEIIDWFEAHLLVQPDERPS